MADIIKFETPADKRIAEIDREMDRIGDEATAKIFQESLKHRNGKEVSYEERSQTTDEWIQSMGEMLLLKKEKDSLIGK